VIVRLIGLGGYGMDVRVLGYQFLDAQDPAKRCSWHMIEGSAACTDGTWRLRYSALTCDESPRLAGWLRGAARADASASAALGDTLVRPAQLHGFTW
jgi:hypothetical protein